MMTMPQARLSRLALSAGLCLMGVCLLFVTRQSTAAGEQPSAGSRQPGNVPAPAPAKPISEAARPAESGGNVPAFKIPAGLPPIIYPDDNPMTPEKVELGRRLFFDKRLSGDNSVSCADCHDPAKGYSNGADFAKGVGGKLGGRNTPSIVNSVYQPFQFWDGRAKSLEEQALGPIQNPVEMNMLLGELETRLRGIEGYREQFRKVFGKDITRVEIAQAIAAFERTLLSGDAPYDRYVAGDKQALSPSAQRGMVLFFNKAHCSACHSGPNFTDHAFHNIGVGEDKPEPDPGRFAITHIEGDRGAYKTPSLREVSRSGPYMHDGSQRTLAEVVEHYDKGGIANPQLDEEIFPLHLSKSEKEDLLRFLVEGLTSDTYPTVTAPTLP